MHRPSRPLAALLLALAGGSASGAAADAPPAGPPRPGPRLEPAGLEPAGLEPAGREAPARPGPGAAPLSPWHLLRPLARLQRRLFPPQEAQEALPSVPPPEAPRLLVLGADGERVLSFKAVIHRGAHEREAEGTTGDLRLSLRRDFAAADAPSPPLPTFVDLAEARDVAGRLLPLAPVRVGPIDARDGPPLVVRLERRPWRLGRLTDAAGAPLAGVGVWVLPLEGPAGGGACGAAPADAARASNPFRLGLEVESGPDGAFAYLDLPGGGARLKVRTPPGWLPVAPVDVPADDPPPTIALQRAAQVRVRVLDPDGAPLAGVNLWARREGDLPTAGASSDAAGWAVFDHVAAGERFVELGLCPPVDRADLRPSAVEGWRAQAGELRVERGHVLVGTVRDERGVPLEGVLVEALSGQGFDVSDRSDAQGRYALGRLRSGPFVLRAAWLRRATGLTADLEVRGEQGRADLTMPPSRSVRVRLVGSSGSGSGSGGRPNPRVLVEGPEGWTLAGYVPRASSFDSTLRVAGLPHGRRAALSWWGLSGRLAYGLLPADGEEAEIRWWPTATLEGRVRDAPEGSTVEVEAGDGQALRTTARASADGAFRASGLPLFPLLVSARARAADGRVLAVADPLPVTPLPAQGEARPGDDHATFPAVELVLRTVR